MGGLIVKKAYVHASMSPVYQGLQNRIHSIYFLATPHRGAKRIAWVKILLSMRLCKPARIPLLSELRFESPELQQQLLNEEFRNSGNIECLCFCETIPSTFGFWKFVIWKALIVDKESATIGPPLERVTSLPASHKAMVKFSDKKSPGYMIISSFLITSVAYIRLVRCLFYDRILKPTVFAAVFRRNERSRKLVEDRCENSGRHLCLEEGSRPLPLNSGTMKYAQTTHDASSHPSHGAMASFDHVGKPDSQDAINAMLSSGRNGDTLGTKAHGARFRDNREPDCAA
ncbi:hypothetical protein B0H63DRAFT_456130 [Podospora didyma]|uniref:DUF676 domain-containing protein n=1 Tax=Podospora didyma TaxID=330526 RepID=A0AAE0JY15_9PEZI|nr:hypothetical protein B0H63DRAFT_456130 [Podospora didyma]